MWTRLCVHLSWCCKDMKRNIHLQTIGLVFSLCRDSVSHTGQQFLDGQVRTLVVVELNEAVYPTSKFVHCVGGIEVDPFLFDGSPEVFYPDIVHAADLAVHTHLDSIACQLAIILASFGKPSFSLTHQPCLL